MTEDTGFSDPPTDTEFCNSSTLEDVEEYARILRILEI